jgi:hypothetical protein
LVEVFREDTRGLRRWAPLLYEALQRNGIEPDPGLLTCLRTALFREELRAREYLRISAEVLATLRRERIPTVVLKGPALGELVYGRMELRHSHDVELLLHDSDHQRAAQLLMAAGFQPTEPTPGRRPLRVVTVHHRSGLPVVLHRHPAGFPADKALTAGLWRRARACTLAGVPTRVLSPEDTLIHVCAYAALSPARTSLLWAADALLLTRGHRGIDWALIQSLAVRVHLPMTLGAMFAYLAEQLDAPIPSSALDRVGADDGLVDPVERDAVLSVARWTTTGGTRQLLGAIDSWPGRALLLRWLCFPSTRYLQETRGLRHGLLAPWLYASRALGYVAHPVGRAVRRRRAINARTVALADAGARPTPPGGAPAGSPGRRG